MKVAIVGTGLIGKRRARVAAEHPRTTLALVVDIDRSSAESVAGEYGCRAGTDWREAVDSDADIVVVATPNDLHAPVCMAALKGGKHVLCEKPLAVNVEEASSMVEEAGKRGLKLKVGCNLRNHPAVSKARELFESGVIGEPMYIRSFYGHGGRPGYHKEWRCDPEKSGGGELVDQGVHLIDLSRWFLGDFDEVFGITTTAYWDIAPLDDNAFALLKTVDGKVASLHASWTQWKNRFQFEVFGKKGYLIVSGLGKSYGPERLVLGKRDPHNPVPKEETYDFGSSDVSWHEEWEELVRAIEADREPLANGRDGLEVLRIAEAIYRSAQSGKVAKVRYA